MFLKTAIHHRIILMLQEKSKNPNRKTLVKLRTSNHKVNIETSRYDKISRCDRICPVCSLDIEDEIHFLFDWAKYSSIGHVRYINIQAWLRGFRVKIANIFKFLLSFNSQKRLGNKENNTNRILIYRTWSIRDDFLNKIANRIPNYKHIPISTLIIQLLNSTDYHLNKQLVQYVTSCLEMRDNLLSKA